jgi:dienelactone hydrolase
VETKSRLIDVRVPKDAEAAVLVVHGGGSRTQDVAVSPTQLSVLRMIPIADRIARTGRNRLAVFRLLNSMRGWDSRHTPVDDVAWAAGEISRRLERDVPLGLVGHSLGGRAAILAAGDVGARSVVALAPWVYPTDGNADVAGISFLIVHGSADRIASPARSAEVATSLRRTAHSVTYLQVEGGKHAMLSHHSAYSGPAAAFTAATLLTPPPSAAERAVADLAQRAGG